MSWFQPTEETCPPLVAKGTVVEIPGFPLLCCFVRGWEGKYAIGCDGTLWSFCNRGNRKWQGPWYQRRTWQVRGKHHFSHLADGNHRETRYIHHLVADAFVGPRPPDEIGDRKECRHLDGNAQNNWWWNLKWGTRQENADDMVRHGRSCLGERQGRVVLTERIVKEARRMKWSGKTIAFASEVLGVHKFTLAHAVSGRTWTHITDPPPYPPRKNKRTDARRRDSSLLGG